MPVVIVVVVITAAVDVVVLVLHSVNVIQDLGENPVLQNGSWYQFPGWGVCVYLKRHINGFDISPFTNMIQIKLIASTYPS